MEKKKKENYVIVRANGAGVFFGILKEKKDNEVTFTHCRKLFVWYGAAAVEQLAVDGVTEPENCKFTVTVEESTVNNWLQILPCTNKAIESIKAVKEWKR